MGWFGHILKATKLFKFLDWNYGHYFKHIFSPKQHPATTKQMFLWKRSRCQIEFELFCYYLQSCVNSDTYFCGILVSLLSQLLSKTSNNLILSAIATSDWGSSVLLRLQILFSYLPKYTPITCWGLEFLYIPLGFH